MAPSAGQFGRTAGLSDSLKNAETLFETQSVAEIREVETRTRNQVEDKKRQLRQLVGNSYRDLISSADTILSMANTCDAVVGNIGVVQADFQRLTAQLVATKDAVAHRPQGASQREQLYAVGGRVKYLVDTPEMIWGCLDTRDYLEAARRFLRASEVYRLLNASASRSVLKRFPLVRTQWPLVTKFRAQIMERVQAQLRGAAKLTGREAADALAAASFLDRLDSEQALKLYLKARTEHAAQQLAAGTGSPFGRQSPAEVLAVLSEAAAAVQEGVCQAGVLFLAPPLTDSLPQLSAAVAEEGLSANELLFGPMPGEAGETEVQAWQALSAAITAKLAPQAQEEVAKEVSKWLETVAKEIQARGGQLLGSCASAAELAEVEAGLRAAILGWRHSSSTPTAAEASNEAVAEAKAGAVPVRWEEVCDWVLGKAVGVWDVLFEAAFLQQSETLIEASFAKISGGLDTALDAALAEAASQPADPPGAFQAASWPQDGGPALTEIAGLGKESARKRQRLAPEAEHAAANGRAALAEDAGWRPRVEQIRASFDEQLREALHGALLLLGELKQPPDDADGGGLQRGSGGLGMAYGLRRAVSPRASALEPYVQKKCAAVATEAAKKLQARLATLPPPAAGAAGASTVEQELLLGRLAVALGTNSAFLRIILGPPEGWRDPKVLAEGASAAAGALGKPASSYSRLAARPAGESELEAIRAVFRAVGDAAYQRWARWAGDSLSAGLASAIAEDPTLASPQALRAWEETVLAGEEELGAGGGEMRFSLPAVASPAALMFLLAACQELERAGGHVVGTPALELLEWELGGSCLAAVRAAAAPDAPAGARVSEKGLLQLLFDLRFLRDVLSGGRPLQPDGAKPEPIRPGRAAAAPTSAEVMARRRAGADLEAALQSRLDPIDWATYEPYLWANEQRFYGRTAVLFGSLMQLNRIHVEGAAKPATPAAAEANILSCAPPAARFSYLPISTPANAARRRAGQPGAAPPAGAETIAAAQDVGDYSFANIGNASATFGQPLVSEVAPETSTLEAIQSKFSSQQLGAFGTLLGDKAAEMTKAASTSLGASSLFSRFSTFTQ